MAMKREGFFGTDNLHRAGWAVLIGLAGFLGALTYNKAFGPQKVVVEAVSSSGLPAQITTELSPRSKEISDLAQAIKQLAHATSNNVEQKRMRELTAEVDRLRAAVARSSKQLSTVPRRGGANSSISAATGDASGQNPSVKFILPESIRGHTRETIFGVSAATCPPSVMTPGVAMVATFNLVDSSLVSSATPLRTTIDKVRTPTSLLQIDGIWSDFQLGSNSISLSPKLEPGNYQFTYGFYLRSKLSGEFPPFYARVCEFVVRES